MKPRNITNNYLSFSILSFFFSATAYSDDAACDAKIEASAKAKWTALTSLTQFSVTGTQVVDQSDTNGNWTKTVIISVQGPNTVGNVTTGTATGSLRVKSSGATEHACNVSDPTIETAQNLQKFSVLETIKKIESMLIGSLHAGTSFDDPSRSCAISMGFSKFLPSEYSNYGAIKTQPNFFFVSGNDTSNFQNQNDASFKFNPDDTKVQITVTDYSPSHLDIGALTPTPGQPNPFSLASIELSVQSASSTVDVHVAQDTSGVHCIYKVITN